MSRSLLMQPKLLQQVIRATRWHWEFPYWHRLGEWVGLVFAVKDRPVFLMAEHIYLVLVKHILYREANWLRSLNPLTSSKHTGDWNATAPAPINDITILCFDIFFSFVCVHVGMCIRAVCLCQFVCVCVCMHICIMRACEYLRWLSPAFCACCMAAKRAVSLSPSGFGSQMKYLVLARPRAGLRFSQCFLNRCLTLEKCLS